MSDLLGSLEGRRYLVRRKVLTLVGASFHVYDEEGALVLFTRQKAFRLREDIRVYASEAMDEERMRISARQVIDFSAAYDVIDSVEGRKVGALRRRGFKSILRDSWQLLDENDELIGEIREDSMAKALVRRFLVNIVPQSFHLDLDGQPVLRFRQRFNPFIFKLDVEITDASRPHIDPRLSLAAGVLLTAIEGRQRD